MYSICPMNSTGNDLTRKAQTDLVHAAEAYIKEAGEHEKKEQEYIRLAVIEKGVADALRNNASDALEQAKKLQTH